MSERSNYVALGLEPGVPSAEIKRACRNLSLKFHPDASRSPDTASCFTRVVRAYKTLCALPEPPLGERCHGGGTVRGEGGGDPVSERRGKGKSCDEGRVRAAAALGLAQGAGEIASAYICCGAELRDAVLEAARATGDKLLLPALEAASADEDPKRRALALELKRRMA